MKETCKQLTNKKLPGWKINQEPIFTFLAKHFESVIPKAGHIDSGTLSQMIEKSKIFIAVWTNLLSNKASRVSLGTF